MAWLEALGDKSWDQERDTQRIRAAFRTLAATRRKWPAPVDLTESLPRFEPLRALPSKASDPERAREMIEKLARELRA